MAILFILGGVIIAICIGPILILLEKPRHWLMKRRGVTELTSKQRRGMARHYKETTTRKKKARRTKS